MIALPPKSSNTYLAISDSRPGSPRPAADLACCLLDGDRLGEVAREVHIETLKNSEPVGNKLKRNDVQKTLEAVDRLGDLNLLSLRSLELFIIGVADDNGLATTSNDWDIVRIENGRKRRICDIPCW